MIIQRQYSLPNCTLILEGFSRTAPEESEDQTSPERLDILTRFECQLAGCKQSLVGGRELLESLATAASECTQEWLSGVRRSHRVKTSSQDDVEYQPLAPNLFRLVIPPAVLFNGSLAAAQDGASHLSGPVELTLSSIQLFDLVEAFDQLLTDEQTLADLSLELRPLPRQNAAATRPVAERTAPAALGIGSLAVAAAALFFVPVPEVQRPRPSTPQSSNPSQSEQPTNAAPPNPKAQQGTAGATLAAAPLITDADQLQSLNQQLYDQVDQAWQTTPTFSEDLIYRVGVNDQGEIVGYQPENQAAIDFAEDVPLLDLLQVPSAGETSAQQPLAQYRVVFTPDGTLEVNSWGR